MANLQCRTILILTHMFFLQTPSLNGVDAVCWVRNFSFKLGNLGNVKHSHSFLNYYFKLNRVTKCRLPRCK